MTPRRRRRSKKWLGWVIFLILVAAAAGVCYAVWYNYFREEPKTEETSTVTTSVPVEAENVAEPDGKGGGEVVLKEEVPQYEGENPNTAAEITGVVTYAGVSGGTLRIRVNINQYLSSGECRLVLTRGGETVHEETVSVIDSASTATCEGFDVPGFAGAAGNYQIAINVKADGKTGTITGEMNL